MGNLKNQILNYDSEYSLDEWENLKSEDIYKKVYEKTHNSTKSQKKNSGASLPT